MKKLKNLRSTRTKKIVNMSGIDWNSEIVTKVERESDPWNTKLRVTFHQVRFQAGMLVSSSGPYQRDVNS